MAVAENLKGIIFIGCPHDGATCSHKLEPIIKFWWPQWKPQATAADPTTVSKGVQSTSSADGMNATDPATSSTQRTDNLAGSQTTPVDPLRQDPREAISAINDKFLDYAKKLPLCKTIKCYCEKEDTLVGENTEKVVTRYS